MPVNKLPGIITPLWVVQFHPTTKSDPPIVGSPHSGVRVTMAFGVSTTAGDSYHSHFPHCKRDVKVWHIFSSTNCHLLKHDCIMYIETIWRDLNPAATDKQERHAAQCSVRLGDIKHSSSSSCGIQNSHRAAKGTGTLSMWLHLSNIECSTIKSPCSSW